MTWNEIILVSAVIPLLVSEATIEDVTGSLLASLDEVGIDVGSIAVEARPVAGLVRIQIQGIREDAIADAEVHHARSV